MGAFRPVPESARLLFTPPRPTPPPRHRATPAATLSAGPGSTGLLTLARDVTTRPPRPAPAGQPRPTQANPCSSARAGAGRHDRITKRGKETRRIDFIHCASVEFMVSRSPICRRPLPRAVNSRNGIRSDMRVVGERIPSKLDAGFLFTFIDVFPRPFLSVLSFPAVINTLPKKRFPSAARALCALTPLAAVGSA